MVTSAPQAMADTAAPAFVTTVNQAGGAVADPLTRAQLVALLKWLGHDVGEPLLRSWAAQGILPPAEQIVPPGAKNRRSRATYPAWMCQVVRDLFLERQGGASLEELKRLSPALQRRYATPGATDGRPANDPPRRIRAQPRRGPAPQWDAPRPEEDPGIATFSATTPELSAPPRIPRALQRAVQIYADMFYAPDDPSPRRATLTLQDERGEAFVSIDFFIPPPTQRE